MKDRNHRIVLTGAEKAFDKIEHIFMIKTLSKVGIERIYMKAKMTKPLQGAYSMGKNYKRSP